MNERYDRARAELRSEAVNLEGKERLLRSLQMSKPTRRPWVRTLGFATAVAGASAALFFGLNRPSYAGDLTALLAQDPTISNSIERVYQYSRSDERDSTANRILKTETKFLGKRGVFIYHGTGTYRQFFEPGRVTDVYPDHAVTEARSRLPQSSGGSLRAFLSKANPTNIQVTRLRWAHPSEGPVTIASGSEVRVGDRVRYEFDWISGEQRGRMVVEADPSHDRILSMRGLSGIGKDLGIEYTYSGVSQRDVTPPSGLPLYDIDDQRKTFLATAGRTLATTTVEGRKLELLALVSDRAGLVTAIVSGSDPIAEADRESLVIDGHRGISDGSSLNGWKGGFDVPFKLAGKPCFAIQTKFRSPIESLKSIEVPLRIGDKQIRVTFRGVQPLVTSSVNRLLAPRNQPFWSETVAEDGATLEIN